MSCEERSHAMKCYKDTRDVPSRREKRDINISWMTQRGFLKKVTSELGLEIRLQGEGLKASTLGSRMGIFDLGWSED